MVFTVITIGMAICILGASLRENSIRVAIAHSEPSTWDLDCITNAKELIIWQNFIAITANFGGFGVGGSSICKTTTTSLFLEKSDSAGDGYVVINASD